jgi:hypothetical protein
MNGFGWRSCQEDFNGCFIKCRHSQTIPLILLTCLCAYTTLPSSFQVPPRRSIRTIRRIWKKRRPRSALVANTCPDVPIPITISDAAIVTMSVERVRLKLRNIHRMSSDLPIIQNGLFKNFRRPMPP